MNITKSVPVVPAGVELRQAGLRASGIARIARRIAGIALLAAAAGLPAPALSAGDPVAGEAAFASYCSGCHAASHSLGRAGAGASEIVSHLVDLSERGVRVSPGAYLDDIAAYLDTLRNYGGLWWNAPAGSESGWGLNVSHQGDMIFATWFTYDASGKGIWFAMSAQKSGAATYAGTFYATRGPAFDSAPFRTAQVAATPVGTGTLTFTDESSGSFEYDVGGASQTKSITRYVFGQMPNCGTAKVPYELYYATNYQDLWWAAPAGSESGWGIHLAHQDATIFATWFTYDADGSPMWLVVTAPRTDSARYEGILYRTTGPAFSAAHFDSADVVATPVGRATFTFPDGNEATFEYTMNGVSHAKSITRQVFRGSGTVCR